MRNYLKENYDFTMGRGENSTYQKLINSEEFDPFRSKHMPLKGMKLYFL